MFSARNLCLGLFGYSQHAFPVVATGNTEAKMFTHGLLLLCNVLIHSLTSHPACFPLGDKSEKQNKVGYCLSSKIFLAPILNRFLFVNKLNSIYVVKIEKGWH